MKRSLASIAAGACLAGSAPALQPASQASPAAGGENTRAAGLEAWGRIYEVFSHPRCANCHVADGRPMWAGPSYGVARAHGINVGGDPDLLFGHPGMTCATCHMAENAGAAHGPPGAEVWHLPPAEMAWWGKSSDEICSQIKDPERNGGRALADIEAHVATDALVAWGWDPGEGRAAAPYSAAETAAFIAAWAEAGAPCPGSGG